MNFNDEVENAEYYTTWQSLPEERKNTLESEKEHIQALKLKMFDYCDIEEVYLSEEFLLKESVNPKLTVAVSLNDMSFVEFLDRRDEILDEDIDILCCIQGACYRVSLDKITECSMPKVKVLIPNERFR